MRRGELADSRGSPSKQKLGIMAMLALEDATEEWKVVTPSLNGQSRQEEQSTSLDSSDQDMPAEETSIFGDFSKLGLTAKEETSPRGNMVEALERDNRLEDESDLKNHKPVFLNRRWQRENNMRQIIRDLAEHGEKLV